MVACLPVLVADQVDANTLFWGIPKQHVMFVQRSSTTVEQSCRAGLVAGRREVDDQRDEPLGPATPRRPAMLVDAGHPYSGQPIRSGRGDQASGRTHRDGADGMPRDTEFGGDRRDRGAVDHQPPQHIPGTAPRRRRSRGRQLAEILIEHRPPTRWRCAAVPRHRNPQHQRVASHRQIRQRPDHGVAIAALATTVRTPRITGHRRAQDRRTFSSTAASVIITPNSIVRMIVSATTDGGQAVASGTGHLGGVV